MDDTKRLPTYDCPWCGNSTGLCESIGGIPGEGWRLRCTGCNAVGPSARGYEGALLAWNRMVGSQGRQIIRERGIVVNEEQKATMRRLERVPTGPLP